MGPHDSVRMLKTEVPRRISDPVGLKDLNGQVVGVEAPGRKRRRRRLRARRILEPERLTGRNIRPLHAPDRATGHPEGRPPVLRLHPSPHQRPHLRSRDHRVPERHAPGIGLQIYPFDRRRRDKVGVGCRKSDSTRDSRLEDAVDHRPRIESPDVSRRCDGGPENVSADCRVF